MIDRLTLTQKGVEAISQAVEEIIALPDPVGNISNITKRPNGIEVGKMKIPLGVIAMIYESRPNVTIDAAVLCLKAGNGIILRGGKEALHSNLALAKCLSVALVKNKLSEASVTVIPDPDRSILQEMLTLRDCIDLVIPRGGEGLIHYVSDNSKIPVIQHFKGVCHLFIDQQADETKALEILLNGKVQRPGVCNALETLLVDEEIKESFLPKVAQAFNQHQVKVHACEQSISFFENAELATEEDYHAEYYAKEIAIRVVQNDQQAITHINQFSSGHTEVIVTENYTTAQHFLRAINSSVVMVNASSRFSDGGQLGLGAEIGISTSKLHAYGPMGLEALTTEKFIVMGNGQIRS